jgi:phospho-N-acetylmuramoyl-pentapeptide-transferase
MNEIIIFDVLALKKLLSLSGLSFLLAIAITPLWTYILYKYRLGKHIRQTAITGEKASYFLKHHQKKEATPTMGGVIILLAVGLITLIFNYNYHTTLLPLFTLIAAGLIGLVDDLLNIYGIGPHGGGLRFRHKLFLYAIISAIAAYWFTYKLEWFAKPIHIPGWGDLVIGSLVLLLFFLITLFFTFAVDVTDGLDGLAGGLLTEAFLVLAAIAYVNGQFGIAVFAGSLVGALMAFLWFNIYPARFFMGGVGAMALGTELAVLSFLTNSVVILPLFGFLFVLEAFSVILQLFSKRVFKKKIFLSAPLHHHLEAIGWPETKITMRAWVLGGVLAIIALSIALVGRG